LPRRRYQLHPLSTVTGGLIGHPIDAAPALLRFYRDATSDLPDDLSVFAALVHSPDGSGVKLAGLAVCHTGDPEQAERDLEPFKAWGSPVLLEVGRMPYPVMNTLLDESYPAGALNYWLSSFTSGLPDGLIDVMVERFATVPSPLTRIMLEHFHGAVIRIGVTDTAVPHRAKPWNLIIPSVWTDPAATEENIRWTKETYTALAEHLTGRQWLNYLGNDQGEDAVRAAYGSNYDRLVDVKRGYDPENVFGHNHNIDPS
jgi:FAD/FMN-containing dehydrogenase